MACHTYCQMHLHFDIMFTNCWSDKYVCKLPGSALRIIFIQAVGHPQMNITSCIACGTLSAGHRADQSQGSLPLKQTKTSILLHLSLCILMAALSELRLQQFHC